KPTTEKPRERGSSTDWLATLPGVNAGPITAARQAPLNGAGTQHGRERQQRLPQRGRALEMLVCPIRKSRRAIRGRLCRPSHGYARERLGCATEPRAFRLRQSQRRPMSVMPAAAAEVNAQAYALFGNTSHALMVNSMRSGSNLSIVR